MAIVGAGAMGCLFGARLKEAGNDVLLMDHHAKTVSEIRRRGLLVRGLTGKVARVRVRISMSPVDLREFDLVLFAVKAYSTAEAARQYGGRVGSRATVLTVQNGLGNVETLTRWFGARRVVAGSTTEASLLLGPGSVLHSGRGRTLVGEVDGVSSVRCLEIVKLFREAGFDARVTGNVKGVVWGKAIVNSAINPLSALTGALNGRLALREGLRRPMLKVLAEGVRVSRAEGVRLEPRDPSGLLFRVLRATAGNRSSMLQDVLNGRRTEIRELNGAIVERGRRLGIPTPYNEFLMNLVLELEENNVSFRRRLESLPAGKS